MADDISTEDLNKKAEALDKIQKLLTGSQESINEYQSTIINMAQSAKREVDKLWESTDKLKRTHTDSNKEIKESYTDLEDYFDTFKEGLIDSMKAGYEFAKSLNNTGGFDATSASARKAATGISLISSAAIGASESIREFGKDSFVGSRSADEMTKNVDALSKAMSSIPGLSGIAGPMVTMFGGISQQVSGVQRMENELVGLRAQFGGFQEVSRSRFIESLDGEMANFNETMRNLAVATGLSSEEVGENIRQLMKIPALYREQARNITLAGQSMTQMEAAMRLARGTTGDLNDMISAMNFQFKSFNTVDEKAYNLLAKTYSVSQQLGQSFKDLEAPIMNISKRFVAFGDNTDSAIRLVGNLSRALMQTGLGIEPTTRIIEGITNKIVEMDLAQAAFLSNQTGGAGGLRGAYEIDMLLSQGEKGVAAVYQKMEQALRQQFGGQIVTQQEAATNDVAASQMTRQLAFLMQGPFGQLVGNRGEAYRLLEAWKQGTTPTAAVAPGAIEQAKESDQKIQERQQTSLDVIAEGVKAAIRQRDVIIAINARMALGGGTERGRLFIKEQAKAATERALNPIQYESPHQALLETIQGTAQQGKGAAEVLGANIKEGVERSRVMREMTAAQARQETEAPPPVMAMEARRAAMTMPGRERGPIEPGVTTIPEVNIEAAPGALNLKVEPAVIRVDINTPEGRSQHNITVKAVTGFNRENE